MAYIRDHFIHLSLYHVQDTDKDSCNIPTKTDSKENCLLLTAYCRDNRNIDDNGRNYDKVDDNRKEQHEQLRDCSRGVAHHSARPNIVSNIDQYHLHVNCSFPIHRKRKGSPGPSTSLHSTEPWKCFILEDGRQSLLSEC